MKSILCKYSLAGGLEGREKKKVVLSAKMNVSTNCSGNTEEEYTTDTWGRKGSFLEEVISKLRPEGHLRVN